jgi:hypothetical protein
MEPKRVWKLAELTEHPLVAEYGLTIRQARRAIARGALVGTRPGGKEVYLTNEAIESWITGSTTKPDA